MENLIVLFGIGVGIGLGLVFLWKLILVGHQEGNRQDYITKIGLLKKELSVKDQELKQANTLLGTANGDCHRLKQVIKHLNRDIDHLKQSNKLEMLKVM